jgi:hypothetical protein
MQVKVSCFRVLGVWVSHVVGARNGGASALNGGRDFLKSTLIQSRNMGGGAMFRGLAEPCGEGFIVLRVVGYLGFQEATLIRPRRARRTEVDESRQKYLGAIRELPLAAHHVGEGLGFYGSEILAGCAANRFQKGNLCHGACGGNGRKVDLAGCFPLGRSCVEELL